jgi:homoserine dehydrogenase
LNTIKVGLCGLGTVGAGVLKVWQRNCQMLEERAGVPIRISHIGARRDNPQCPVPDGIRVSRDLMAVVQDPDVHILVELIGGTGLARELVLAAIEQGKHVVTANKALIAEFGNDIFAKAEAKGVFVAFEAAVAGGIPIIRTLREGLAANRIEWLAGIINGTGNFILTEMRDKGRAFADVLAEAQALGYAEADPTFDVEGIDAAHKLVILASLAFGMPLQFNKVYCEGISAISPLDVTFANELGYRIKHLGLARLHEQGVELRVHPTLISERQLIAKVDGVDNAVLVKGDAVGTTLYCGPGAGSEPTASSVIADIVDLSRQLTGAPEQRAPALGCAQSRLRQYPLLPITAIKTRYYLRLSALDKPGVLSRIAQILSDQGISIEALIQKAPQDGETAVPVIVLTNCVQEAAMNEAITQMQALETVLDPIVRIRVENLK